MLQQNVSVPSFPASARGVTRVAVNREGGRTLKVRIGFRGRGNNETGVAAGIIPKAYSESMLQQNVSVPSFPASARGVTRVAVNREGGRTLKVRIGFRGRGNNETGVAAGILPKACPESMLQKNVSVASFPASARGVTRVAVNRVGGRTLKVRIGFRGRGNNETGVPAGITSIKRIWGRANSELADPGEGASSRGPYNNRRGASIEVGEQRPRRELAEPGKGASSRGPYNNRRGASIEVGEQRPRHRIMSSLLLSNRRIILKNRGPKEDQMLTSTEPQQAKSKARNRNAQIAAFAFAYRNESHKHSNQGHRGESKLGALMSVNHSMLSDKGSKLRDSMQ